MTSKHRITVGEELRYDVDLSGLHNLSGTYSQLWATPAASTTLTGTLAAWVVTAVDCTAGAGARTLPAANSVIAGTAVCAKKADASTNALVVSRAGADLIFGTGSGATSKTLSLAGEAVEFVSNGVDKWTIRASDTPSGALAATYAAKASNLSDLANAGTARTNLGLGASATMSTTQIAADSALTSAYGPPMVVPTGVAATDTAAIQAAHDALPAAGGDIRLAAGAFLVTAGGVTFSKTVRLRGAGPSSGPPSTAEAGAGQTATNLTTIQCASATGNALTITSDGCVVQDLAVVNTSGSAPTAGAGIVVTAEGSGSRFLNVSVSGFFYNFDLQSGYEQYMVGCLSSDFAKSGLRIANPTLPDAGDFGITNCQFIAGPNRTAPQSAIEWISAGGMRLNGCKINKRGSVTLTLGVFLHPADGISTSVFTITGNSIENCSYGVYCDDTGNTGTGTIAKIAIVGNEFSCATKCIAFGRATTGKVKTVTISGNAFTAGTTTGVSLGNIDTVMVSGNVYDPATTTQLSISAGVTNLFLAPGFSFTTAARPAATIMRAGSTYYDTTLSKQAWSDGTNWKDATATNV